MFDFVCKTVLLHSVRRCPITTNYKHFPSSLFVKCISTTPNQHSFAVTYLINSCGFPQKSALSASIYLHFDSPEKPDSVIDFFKSHGFSERQISKVIRGYPRVLCISPENILLPKLHFFKTKGFSSSDIAKIFSVCPRIVFRSLEKHIIPSFNVLSDRFLSCETAVAVINRNPTILNNDFETYMTPIINVLRDIGVSERNILYFLSRRYHFNKTSMTTLKNVVEVVKDMGISPLSSNFVLAVTAKLYGRINWESKVETYRRWGWSEEEFLAAFCKNPSCVLVSKDKIMTAMDFLVNKLDLESSAIAKRPDVISYSMEKRLIPRAAVFQFLLSKGLIKKNSTNLIAILTLSEKAFLQKVGNSYDEAPELLKLYQEKLDLAKLTKASKSRERDTVIV